MSEELNRALELARQGGAMLRAYRIKQKLSQRKMARLLSIHQQDLSAIERAQFELPKEEA